MKIKNSNYIEGLYRPGIFYSTSVFVFVISSNTGARNDTDWEGHKGQQGHKKVKTQKGPVLGKLKNGGWPSKEEKH